MNAYVVAQEKDLGNAATRLLVWIALNVDDERTPRIYYAGAEHRAQGLRTGTANRSIRDLMAELKASGVIVQRSAAHPGRNGEFELTFAPREWRRNNRPLPDGMAAEKTSNGGGKDVGMAAAEPPPYPKRSQGSQEGDEPPPSRCSKHLHHDQPPACWACKDARERREAWDITHAPAKRQFKPWGVECAPGEHKFVPDGTCMLCDYRPALDEVEEL
ncbi:hypothetical protein [Microbacterium sp. P02]|uniref:hypothetical protein n=1 Tax=Microbacterium sp. P02 TaxID=3366260 RepID=UPI0036720552